jgi:predicted transcriptional regulator
MVDRKPNNVIRTLRTMEKYGLVLLKKEKSNKGRSPIVPEVICHKLSVDILLTGKDAPGL